MDYERLRVKPASSMRPSDTTLVISRVAAPHGGWAVHTLSAISLQHPASSDLLQRVTVATAPTDAEITFGADMTNHGHSQADIKNHIKANWATKVLMAGNKYSMRWGEGAPAGIIFWLNANNVTVTHAQSGASKIASTLFNEGKADESTSWRKKPPPGGGGSAAGAGGSTSSVTVV